MPGACRHCVRGTILRRTPIAWFRGSMDPLTSVPTVFCGRSWRDCGATTAGGGWCALFQVSSSDGGECWGVDSGSSQHPLLLLADIPQMVVFYLSRFSKKFRKIVDSISQDTMDRLMNYAWPGNIRELQNVIERAVILSPGPALLLDQDLVPGPALATVGCRCSSRAQSAAPRSGNAYPPARGAAHSNTVVPSQDPGAGLASDSIKANHRLWR